MTTNRVSHAAREVLVAFLLALLFWAVLDVLLRASFGPDPKDDRGLLVQIVENLAAVLLLSAVTGGIASLIIAVRRLFIPAGKSPPESPESRGDA